MGSLSRLSRLNRLSRFSRSNLDIACPLVLFSFDHKFPSYIKLFFMISPLRPHPRCSLLILP